MISENSVIQKSKEILVSVVDNEAVILGIKNGKYIGLNEIGTEIWIRLDQPIKISRLIQEFTETYDEKEESIIHDHVMEFLTILHNKSLIQILDEA